MRLLDCELRVERVEPLLERETALFELELRELFERASLSVRRHERGGRLLA